MSPNKLKLLLSLTALAVSQSSNSIELHTKSIQPSSNQQLSSESYSVEYEYIRKLKLLIDKTESDHPNLKFNKEMVIKGLSDSLLDNAPTLNKEDRRKALAHLDTLTSEGSKSNELDLNYQNGLLAQSQAKQLPGAMSTASGLLYHVITSVTDGEHPIETDIVTLNYT